MNILCRIGIHRWKVVMTYIAEGFPVYIFGVSSISRHKYKGERCKHCHKWRKEDALYWWQWLAILFLASVVVVPTVLLIGWLALLWLVLAITVGFIVLASIFALSM